MIATQVKKKNVGALVEHHGFPFPAVVASRAPPSAHLYPERVLLMAWFLPHDSTHPVSASPAMESSDPVAEL